MTSPHEVALLRLVAQRLAGPGATTATEAVRWLGAVQAQDHPGAVTSVALRTADGTRQAVESAFDAGTIVRSWPMRGTLHVIAAEDLGWVLDLTATPALARAARRRAQLGIDQPLIEQAHELAVDALSKVPRMRRADLLAAWEAGGVATSGQRGYHLLGHLAQTGTLCFGPVVDGEQRLVLVDWWIPRRRRLERHDALGEWARRYFRSHGPATVQDFARWTKLGAADVRAGIALARPDLDRIDVDGVEHLLDPETPDRLRAWREDAGGVYLLPGFDELMLGYGDRSASLPVELASRIVPGGNGVFRPTVVSDGQVVGTWDRAGSARARRVLATAFTSFSKDVDEALPRVYAALP